MAIKPISKGLTCSQKMLTIMNGNHSLKEDATNALIDGFEDSADFEFVYRNTYKENLLKAWITDGTTEDKTLGYKKMVSYPYNPIAFSVGDYLYFDYYHVGEINYKNWSPWLILALDYQNYYTVDARLCPCNLQIKWQNKKKDIFEYPCYFEDTMKYTTLDFGQQGVTIQGADVILYVQDNEDTKTLYINQRFIFKGRAFVIKQLNPEINKNLIKIFMSITQIQPNDDVVNDIAWNGDEIVLPINPTTTENIIYPNITGIVLNKTVGFNIYSYINGIKQNSEFSFELSGVDLKYYEFTKINGNNFSIKNIKQYADNPLKIQCTNNDTQEIVIKDIWLKGVF